MFDSGFNVLNPSDRIVRSGGSVVVGSAGQVTITPKAGQNTQITSGSLGIGLSPSYTLDVSGQTRISGTVGIGGVPLSSYALNILSSLNASSGQAYGSYVQPTLTATANGDSFFGVRIGPSIVVGGFTGTTAYSIYIDGPTGAASNYAIYAAGAAQSYFGGSITSVGSTLTLGSNWSLVQAQITSTAASSGTTEARTQYLAGNSTINATVGVDGNTSGSVYGLGAPSFVIRTVSNHLMSFWTANVERVRIDTSGNLIQTGGYYAQGSSVATTGSIRFGATPSIYCTHGASNIRMISDDGTFVWIGLNGFADTKIDSAGFYLPNITTTASAANAFIDNSNSNKVLRSTSSLRYKDVLGGLPLDEAYRLVLGLKPIKYTSRSTSDDPDRVHVGFGAEDVAALDERFVVLDAKGRPDGVQYGVLTAPLAAVVQDLTRRLRELETAGAR